MEVPIHFAASKSHLGIYPGEEAIVAFADELSEYSVSKGTIRVPYGEPLTAELIDKVARWCYEKYSKYIMLCDLQEIKIA